MKFIPLFFYVVFIVFYTSNSASALDRKSILEVTTDEIIVDTQVSPKGVSEDHTAVVWWLPQEFWDSTFARDASLGEKDKAAMREAMRGISLLGVVQADMSRFGSFKFYPKEDIQRFIQVQYTDKDGKVSNIGIVEDVNPDLEVILGAMKPILAQALGNMGENLHFFVLKDRDSQGNRLVDPYSFGVLDVKLQELSGNKLTSQILLPLNSLFVSRKCSNGRDAHATWVYCPWTGEKL